MEQAAPHLSLIAEQTPRAENKELSPREEVNWAMNHIRSRWEDVPGVGPEFVLFNQGVLDIDEGKKRTKKLNLPNGRSILRGPRINEALDWAKSQLTSASSDEAPKYKKAIAIFEKYGKPFFREGKNDNRAENEEALVKRRAEELAVLRDGDQSTMENHIQDARDQLATEIELVLPNDPNPEAIPYRRAASSLTLSEPLKDAGERLGVSNAVTAEKLDQPEQKERRLKRWIDKGREPLTRAKQLQAIAGTVPDTAQAIEVRDARELTEGLSNAEKLLAHLETQRVEAATPSEPRAEYPENAAIRNELVRNVLAPILGKSAEAREMSVVGVLSADVQPVLPEPVITPSLQERASANDLSHAEMVTLSQQADAQIEGVKPEEHIVHSFNDALPIDDTPPGEDPLVRKRNPFQMITSIEPTPLRTDASTVILRGGTSSDQIATAPALSAERNVTPGDYVAAHNAAETTEQTSRPTVEAMPVATTTPDNANLTTLTPRPATTEPKVSFLRSLGRRLGLAA